MSRKHILWIFLCGIFVIIVFPVFLNNNPKKVIGIVHEKNEDNQTGKLILQLQNSLFSKFDTAWCYMSKEEEIPNNANWTKANKDTCKMSGTPGDYYIYLKTQNQIFYVGENSIPIDEYATISLPSDPIYIAKGSQKTIMAEVKGLSEGINITWNSSNSDIASVENGTIIGKNYGEVIITASLSEKMKSEIKVTVSPLIVTKPKQFNSKKSYLKCNQFSSTDAQTLDTILFSRIQEVGEHTRAGVVEAARFLALEFPYRISYFFENGRLNNHYNRYVDGEGRYYHKGLYLSTDKYLSIKASLDGPAMWGCNLINRDDSSYFVLYQPYPNGLDCSGFVSWALLNGGFDVGDSGAGDISYYDDDLSDLGEQVKITSSLLNSNRVKVGDLIGLYGHIALIVGIDEQNIYVAESLVDFNGLMIHSYSKRSIGSIYQYIILMDSVYQQDGKLTNMW